MNIERFSTNGATHQDWMECELTPIHINPNTGKPYFKINDNAWDGEWVACEVTEIPSGEWGGDDE